MPVKRTNKKTGRVEVFGRVTLPNGRRKEKKFPSKKKALEWEVLVKQRLREFSKQTPAVSLHSLMTEHLLAMKAKGISDGQYREKDIVFKALLKESGVSPVMHAAELPHDVVRRMLDKVAEDVSGYRANRWRQHLMRLWSWGKRARRVQGDCPWDVEKYKEERSERYVPSEEDFWRVYSVIGQEPTSYTKTRGHSVDVPALQRLLLTFLHTGEGKARCSA